MIIKYKHIDDYTYEWLYMSDYMWHPTSKGTILYKVDDEGILSEMVSLKEEGWGYTEIMPIFTNPVISPQNYPKTPEEKATIKASQSQGISLASLMGV